MNQIESKKRNNSWTPLNSKQKKKQFLPKLPKWLRGGTYPLQETEEIQELGMLTSRSKA